MNLPGFSPPKNQGLQLFQCTNAKDKEVCRVFSALSFQIFQTFAPQFIHNFNDLVVAAIRNPKCGYRYPLKHVGRYVQARNVGRNRKNKAVFGTDFVAAWGLAPREFQRL